MSDLETKQEETTDPTYREVNFGRIVGDNSYELAVKHGKFEGTEEEYVEKEQKTFDDMVAYCESVKEELSGITPLPQKVLSRMNDLGEISSEQVDTIMESYGSSDAYHLTEDGKLVYTCSSGTELYIGMENEESGAQVRLGFTSGLMTRFKKDGVWGSWVVNTNISDGEVI